jgi:hypothetical protein
MSLSGINFAAKPVVLDAVGVEIDTDDWLAVSILQYKSAVLRIGKVVKITDTSLTLLWSEHRDVLNHTWYRDGSRIWQPKVSSVQHGIKKFIKIDKPVDFLDVE